MKPKHGHPGRDLAPEGTLDEMETDMLEEDPSDLLVGDVADLVKDDIAVVEDGECADPEIHDIIDQAISRRGFMRCISTLAVGAVASAALPGPGRVEKASAFLLPDFKPVPASTEDTVIVPEGFEWRILVSWGCPAVVECAGTG